MDELNDPIDSPPNEKWNKYQHLKVRDQLELIELVPSKVLLHFLPSLLRLEISRHRLPNEVYQTKDEQSQH